MGLLFNQPLSLPSGSTLRKGYPGPGRTSPSMMQEKKISKYMSAMVMTVEYKFSDILKLCDRVEKELFGSA